MEKYIATNRILGATHIKIEVRYEKGGYNYFTYKEEPRGVYVSVSPVALEDRPGGYQMESYVAFSGVKVCVKELKRKSDKTAQEVWSKIEPKCERIAQIWADLGSSAAVELIWRALL